MIFEDGKIVIYNWRSYFDHKSFRYVTHSLFLDIREDGLKEEKEL